MTSTGQTVLDSDAIERVLRRVASEIVDRTRGTEGLALIGIHRGGVPIAARIAREIARAEGHEVPVGSVDITFYRDDAHIALPDPKLGPSEIDFDLKDLDVVLVDDVLHTGRTVRAAIDHLMDYGRPRRIWLAVLCDRGGRELPIAPDFVGRDVEVPEGAQLVVSVDGDEPDAASVVRRGEA